MLVMSGCYSTEDAFMRRLAKLGCVQARHCEPEAFDATFASMGECRDEQEAALQESIGASVDAGCEYIAKQGRECIHAVYRNRKTCSGFESEIETACAGVLVCPRDAELDDEEPMQSAFEPVLSTPGPDE